MIFLPIIERELRVRARSRSTYWVRLAAGLVGLLFCFQQLVVTALMRTPAALGRNVFNGIIAAAFLFGCSACLLTADAISTERREGTLGLLFLTGVKSVVVLLGKLVSAGLIGLCAMIAFLPALVLPLLAGGVGAGEITRKSAALLATLWFALGAGLCGSAIQRDRTKAIRGAILITALIVLLPCLSFAVSAGGVMQYLGLLSPLVLMVTAGEPLFAASPHLFWISLAVVQTLGCLLVTGAGLFLHRAVRLDSSAVIERPVAAVKEAKRAIGFGRWRPEKEDSDPVEWLVFRGGGVNAGIWVVAVLGLVGSRLVALMLPFFGGPRAPGLWLLAWPLGIGGAILGGAMVASVACRFFARVRRTGELELLLPSPVGARTLISDQWRVLSRVFVWPVLVVQAAMVVPVFALVGGPPGASILGVLLVSLGLNLVNTALGSAALCWLGMRYGLKAHSQPAAVLSTVALAQGVPWVILMVTGMIPFLADILLMVFYAGLLTSTRERLLRALVESESIPLVRVHFL